jgi:hypothetical protein
MSDTVNYGVLRKILLRVEAACELSWAVSRMRTASWDWGRHNLRPVRGRVDPVAVCEIEGAVHSVARFVPFTALCVPATAAALRMLRRRGIAASAEWTPPGVRGPLGHVALARS